MNTFLLIILVIVILFFAVKFIKRFQIKKRINKASMSLYLQCEDILTEAVGKMDSIAKIEDEKSINLRIFAHWVIITIIRETAYLSAPGNPSKLDFYLHKFDNHFFDSLRKMGVSYDDRVVILQKFIDNYSKIERFGDWKTDGTLIMKKYSREYLNGDETLLNQVVKSILQIDYVKNMHDLGLTIPYTMFVNDVVKNFKNSFRINKQDAFLNKEYGKKKI